VVGTFVTSLNGPGFSVTVLKIQPGFEELLNAKTTAPAWPNVVEPYHGGVHGVVQRSIMVTPPSSPELTKDFLFPVDTLLVQNIIQSVVENVTRDEPQITRYDTIAGDGDCGETLLKGVKGLSWLMCFL
jgi:dihydroxyacetone kinase